MLEDILNTDQRPKVDDYGDYLFLVARFFDYDAATLSVTTEQVSFVIGKDFVLTFQERPTGRFDPVREWLRTDKGRIRQLGTDYLAYALLDLLVDRYFTVLEQIGERTEDLEDELMAKPERRATADTAPAQARNPDHCAATSGHCAKSSTPCCAARAASSPPKPSSICATSTTTRCT